VFSPTPPKTAPHPHAISSQPKAAPVVKPKPVEPKSAPSTHAPTWIRVSIDQGDQDRLAFHIQTDGGPGYPLWVEIVGRAGRLTGRAAYFKRLKIYPQADGRLLIPKTALELTPGYYLLNVSYGDLKRTAAFSLGTKDRDFWKDVAHQRKLSSYLFWSERKHLFQTAQRLGKAWTKGKRLRIGELDDLSEAKGGDYLFFDEWMELKGIYASKSQSDLKRFMEKISELTIWKS
jgi:hypothetical protein